MTTADQYIEQELRIMAQAVAQTFECSLADAVMLIKQTLLRVEKRP